MKPLMMLPAWRVEEIEADVAYIESRQQAAFERFERTASELAGADETLRRVLRARLRDAYREGRGDHSLVR